ncbi:MAG: hypothetical protein AAFN70_20465, partial [Planctomycetota bacterium]
MKFSQTILENPAGNPLVIIRWACVCLAIVWATLAIHAADESRAGGEGDPNTATWPRAVQQLRDGQTDVAVRQMQDLMMQSHTHEDSLMAARHTILAQGLMRLERHADAAKHLKTAVELLNEDDPALAARRNATMLALATSQTQSKAFLEG